MTFKHTWRPVADYRFVKRMNDGLVGLTSSYGMQLFVTAKLRKETKCAICKFALISCDQAYRPITNGYNRMHRICVSCIEELEHEK